ncbi:hypothetical protein N7533_011006 [Penicillium manginii]|uniref:uncharacterized protein n=1 Tax=Penicillium manginii TaxID=203109 RepID=UPI002549850E|nr:uncharacterized protein N7533_011006 [Penicillium manginii]KAJ5741597.1 hypothetical protein N7533_011006 [Penicillium manginii]
MESPASDAVCFPALIMDPPIVDFTYRGKYGQWESFDILQQKAHSIQKQQRVYWTDRIEARINESFTCKSPIVEQLSDDGLNTGASLQWIDLISADLSQVSPSSDGKYRYNTGEFRVVVTQEDRDTLCSAFLRKLVHSADPEDLDEEKNARVSAKTDVLGLLNEVHHASETLQGVLDSLELPGKMRNDTFHPSALLAPPCSESPDCQTPKSAIPGISSEPPDGNEALPNEEPNPVTGDKGALASERDDQSKNSGFLLFSMRKSKSKASDRRRNGGRWSVSERKDLKEYIRGREELSWQQKVDGYRRRFGSHRSDDSIKTQARLMGFHVPDQKKSKVVKLKTRLPSVDSNRLETAGSSAMDDSETGEILYKDASSGSRTPQSLNASKTPDTSASIGEMQPVEATPNLLVDGGDSLFGLHPSFNGPQRSRRSALEQLLN